MNARISYWLMPAEPEKAQLTEIIRDLAARVSGPVFEPHVTLYSGLAESPERIAEILREASRGISELVLKPAALAHADQFTKTLFVEFAADDALTLLAAKLKHLSAQPEHYELKSHLSLVYARLDGTQRQALADSIVIPRVIRFDLLKAVLTGTATLSPVHVEAWQVAAERKWS